MSTVFQIVLITGIHCISYVEYMEVYNITPYLPLSQGELSELFRNPGNVKLV